MIMARCVQLACKLSCGSTGLDAVRALRGAGRFSAGGVGAAGGALAVALSRPAWNENRAT